MNGSCGRLPDVIVIGAQKCGTSSLHRYLDLHPEIEMSAKKETDFFVHHWERGVDWYRAHFQTQAPVCGESSPSYTVHPWTNGIPERIHATVPDAKLIYMVRDPVERLISQYIHNYSRCIESRPWKEVFNLDRFDESDYVCRGRYHLQLEQYLEHFRLSQMLVIDQDELRSDAASTMRQVFAFIGVDESVPIEGRPIEANKSAYRRRPRAIMALNERLQDASARAASLPKPVGGALTRVLSRRIDRPELDIGLRHRLEEMFREDAARLRNLTGKSFPNWSV